VKRPLKLSDALDALPRADDLSLLRAALVGASREDGGRAWTAADAYATLGTRLADADALEAGIAALAERARDRVERVMRHSVAALRAIDAGDPAAAARALIAAGEVEEEEGRLEEAESFFRRAAELGRKPRDRGGEALALRRLGRVARARGALNDAVRFYTESFQVGSAQRDAEGAVVACQGLGNVRTDQGLWANARGWYERGLELLGDGGSPVHRWQLYVNMAVVELRTGALDACERWLDRADEVGDPGAAVHIRNGRGRLALARGRPDEAHAEFQAALEHASSPYVQGTILINVAEVHLARGRVREAEQAARALEAVALAHSLITLLPYVYRTLGAVARARGDGEAFIFYEQALGICRGEAIPAIELATTQHEYALLDAEQGRTESATARLEVALEIFRELGTGPETERAAAELARIAGTDARSTEEG
jgi:tetratricopeptide (TPR) repeat protein